MGYRSSWYLAIEGDTASKVIKNIKEKSLPENLLEFLDCAENDNSAESIYFEMHDTKMYESYPDIEEFYSFLDSLEDEDFKYYEIGEEEGDISDKGENCDLLYVRTEIIRG